jgi:hypothetical protein
MSYRLTDGYLRPSADGYVRLFKDGYSAFLTHDGYSVFLGRDGYNVALFASSGAVFDGGKGIAYIADRTTAPDGYQPTGGGWMYSEGGDGYWSSSRGVVQSFTGTLNTRAFPSDANYTAVIADYRSNIMQFIGGTTLTATRNVVVPIIAGYQWTIYNGTTGAQSIQIIGATGTGVTIANGKRAIVYADGTNIVRVTPDT